jgi:hypothetical protein
MAPGFVDTRVDMGIVLGGVSPGPGGPCGPAGPGAPSLPVETGPAGPGGPGMGAGAGQIVGKMPLKQI